MDHPPGDESKFTKNQDAGHAEAIQRHLDRLLESRAYPKTICPSEVARALSAAELDQLDAKDWREVMPEIRRVVWEMRDGGLVEVLQKGSVLDESTQLEDVKGPIRIRSKKARQQ